MSKHLYLLRHAKSSWEDATLADHDRPLSGRGRRAAKAIGRHMAAEGIEPGLVLCSSAVRARETFARIETALGRGAVKVERQLYGAGAAALTARLRRVSDRFESVLVIGHNPGIHELALALAEPAPASLHAKYPTGALATLELAAESWRDLANGCGELVGFVRPRDLEPG